MQDDLMEVEKVLPDKVERNYYVKYQPYHEYFFMSEQGPEDVALFTTWDIEKSEIVAGKWINIFVFPWWTLALTLDLLTRRNPTSWCRVSLYR